MTATKLDFFHWNSGSILKPMSALEVGQVEQRIASRRAKEHRIDQQLARPDGIFCVAYA